MSANFAFRRFADPFVLTVGPSSASTQVTIAGDAKFPSIEEGRSFYFVNPNPFYVRLKGSKGAFSAVTETTGWLFPPHSAQVFSTQNPDFVSVMAVTRGGLTAATGTCELSYGVGS